MDQEDIAQYLALTFGEEELYWEEGWWEKVRAMKKAENKAKWVYQGHKGLVQDTEPQLAMTTYLSFAPTCSMISLRHKIVKTQRKKRSKSENISEKAIEDIMDSLQEYSFNVSFVIATSNQHTAIITVTVSSLNHAV